MTGRTVRRWAWRGTLAVLALAILLGTAGTVRAFSLACAGSLEGLRYLRDVRTQIQVSTALPPTPMPPPPTSIPSPTLTPTRAPTQPLVSGQATATLTPQAPTATPTLTPTPIPAPPPPTAVQRARAVAGGTVDAALGAFLRFKQSDEVAYPAHIVAAHVLGVAGCGPDAVRLQWLKAGLHAVQEGQPERIAAALGESASSPDDLLQLREIVRAWTEQQHWSAPMRRVQAAFEAQTPG